MYWKQFYAWGELNELNNKCSTFVLFDLIRKCGRQTSDYRQVTTDRQWQRSDYREATATTENRIPLQRLQGQSRQE